MSREKFVKGIGKRIRKFRKAKGMNVQEFATLIGVSQGTLSDIENENAVPSGITLALLARKTDINIMWLLTGKGQMFAEGDVRIVELGGQIAREAAEKYDAEEDYVLIPFHSEVMVSAGTGVFPREEVGVPIAISRRYLRRYLGLTTFRGLSLVPIYGDSMEPTLPDRSFAIVQDCTVDDVLIDGRVYVVLVDNLLYIKRVYFDRSNRKLYLSSDNHNVPRIEIDWTDEVRIIGRVVGCVNVTSL